MADVSGTWALQQALVPADIDSPTVETALATSELRGYSVRFAWDRIDGSTAMLDAALQVARAHKLELSIRFMAGRWTPQRVFDAGSPYYTVGGQKVPTPFTAGGGPNTVFESAYEQEVRSLAAWCRANGVHLLHLPWYGQNYAELNNGIEVRSAPGYSYQAWLTGHERLFDVAWQFAGPDLAIEFPLSGYGPLVQASGDLARYIAAKSAGTQGRVYVQANGLDSRGDWGAASPGLEQQMEQAVWSQPVDRGEQMIGTADYDWDGVYSRLRSNHAVYVEVYVQSFSPRLGHHDQLVKDILAFAQG